MYGGNFTPWKGITHLSARHSEYSRIDYFFMNKIDRHKIEKCSIGVTDLSDHSIIYLSIHLNGRRRNTLWKLNVGMINNREAKEEIKK